MSRLIRHALILAVAVSCAVGVPSTAFAATACDHPAPVLNLNVAAGGNIQAAIDQVSAAGGGCVNLAAGTWTLTTSLQLRTKVALNGRGSATVLRGPTSVYSFPLLTVAGAAPRLGVIVENLVVDGRIPRSALTTDPNATNPYFNSLGIFFNSGSSDDRDTLIRNVEVKNTAMGIHVKGVVGLTLDRVDVHHNAIAFWHHNAYLRRTWKVNVVDSKFNDALIGTGLHVAGAAADVTLSRSEFSRNSNSGMNIQDTPTNFTIKDSVANDNGGHGISATGNVLTINANRTLDNALDGIHTWAGAGSVTNNVSLGNGESPLDIHGSFTVSGNTTS